ncbi:MAG: SDR family oxidoreductase [Candidatus Eremiobacteraeota bacterium]|nr:SDR family oxidoreductase [Candidatus Eremiobacteraeota bacterium]
MTTSTSSPFVDAAALTRALRSVVVTGGASGLGEAVVGAVYESGGAASVLDVRAPRDGAAFFPTDVSDFAAVSGAIEAVVRERGEITSLVCCAGIDACGPIDGVSAEAWDRVTRVNLIGVANAVRAGLPHLERGGGRIAIVASTLGLRAFSDATAYCASKFGVVGFTRALATETAGRVGITLVIPGGMATPFFDGRTEQYKPPPGAALNRPIDVARAIVFALAQPPGCEIREMVVCPSKESSWP